MKIIDKVKTLPELPGVYLMKDAAGNIIYVGKASSLKKRVRSYFTKSHKPLKQEILINQIRDIDFIPTASEAEALILEAGLIKEYKPKYNIEIKDDKAYPRLKLTIKEKFPRLLIARRKKDDGARYFGPYTSTKLLKQALKFMRRVFPLRICRVMPKAPCLNYHLKQCQGPCLEEIGEAAYKKIVENLILFLEGRKLELIKRLTQQMAAAASAQNFEEAVRFRDQIASLSLVCAPHRQFKTDDQLEELRQVLKLDKRPVLIEAFDISHIFGRDAVGSMISFKEGLPDKSKYRRFKIKMITGIDDYAMLKEVLKRRYQGSLSKKMKLPGLILIDGGKGHLQISAWQLKKLNINIPVISIAKQFEYVYVPWQSKPLALSSNSKAKHLLMRIRDEAHRFALAYHRLLRKKISLFSALDEIPGIGKKRREILINSIDNIMKLKQLTLKQLQKIKGIDERTAKNIIDYWKRY